MEIVTFEFLNSFHHLVDFTLFIHSVLVGPVVHAIASCLTSYFDEIKCGVLHLSVF